jgi:tetratricopeptide (TPR) repeat protein
MTGFSFPALIGRDDDLAELSRLLYASGSQNVALILLSGEEGIGKSSLLRAATVDAREHGFVVLEGRPPATELPQPFFLLHELMNSLTTQRETETTAPQDGLKNMVTLGFSRPGGRDRDTLPMGLLPFSASLESPDERERRLLAALTGRETSIKDEEQVLFDQLADHLDEVAAEKSVLLAIDDLHYADQASMNFLGYLSRRTRGRKTKVMATCRPEIEVLDTVRSILHDVEHEGLLHRLEVKRLTLDESREFLSHLSRGKEIPPATALEWFTTSQGNPLALMQLFRRGMTSVDIAREGPARASAVLAKLGEDDRRVLSHAAVLGMSFRFQSLYEAVGGDEEKLAGIVDSQIQSGILRDREGESYEFSNEELWKGLYNSMSESRRRILHRKAAEAYEKMYPEPTPDIIPEMGRHFHLGQVHDKSLLYNRYAATQAMGTFSPDTAIFYLERAREDLAALPGNHKPEEAEVLKELGEQYDAMGDATRADEFYGKSLEKLPEDEVTLRALLILSRADAARDLDHIKLSRQYCEEAIRLLEKVGHKKGLAMAHRSLGRAAYKEGQFEVTKREIEATLKFLDPEKDARDVARCYIDLGNIYTGMTDESEQARGIEFFHKAIQALEKLHDYRELARAHNNLAMALMPAHPAEAMEEIMKARTFSEKAKDRRGVGWRLYNSVEIFLALGKVDEATRNNDEAGKILSLLNDRIGIQQVVLNNGILAQYRKSYDEAERAYLEALRLAEDLGYYPKLVEARIRLGTLYADWGKKEDALKEISRIREMGEDTGDTWLNSIYENLKKQVGG